MAFTLNRRLAQLVDSDGKLNSGKVPDNEITSDHLHTSFQLSPSHVSSTIEVDHLLGANQHLETTDDVQFNNLTLTGSLRGPATMTIDPAAVGDNTGTLVIAGNLQVDGTTTTINSTTLEVDDLNITLASGAANAAAANGAGITVDGASATITYDGTNDEWDFNKDINVTGTISSGAITVSGDVMPVAENLHSIGSASVRWEDLYVDDGFIRNAFIDEYIYHNGNTGTNLRFLTDRAILTSDGGAIVDAHSNGNLYLTGTTVQVYGNYNSTGTINSGAITADGLTVNSGAADTVATFQSTDQFADLALTDSGGTSYIRNSNGNLIFESDRANTIASSSMLFKVDSVTALTFNSSQNATFAGTISSGAITSSGTSTFSTAISVGTTVNTDTLHLYKYQADHGIRIQGSSSNWYFLNKYSDSGNLHITNNGSADITFDSSGNITNIGSISSGGITSSAGITANGPFKSGGSNNYILLDYDGDFTGGNYYAIQDTSDNKLRISYGFSSTDCIEMDSSGNVTIPGGNLVVSGGVVSASNLKRNDQTSGATVESSLWRSTSTYAYSAENGLRYYWIRIAQIAPSNCRGLIEYEAKTDENYPGFTRGTIAYSGFSSGSSFSIQHDQNTAEGVPVVVRVDTSRQIWIQVSNAWANTFRWRISNYGSTLTNVDTSWTVGSNKLDPNSTSVPPNSSGNIEPGQNLRATSSSVTGTIPTYDYYKQGNVRSDKQIVDTDVVYNGAVPLNFQYRGSDTYTKTVLYDGQNNTANNVFSGLTWEMGRLTNSDSATPRTFTISDRGAANRWCFSQYGLSFNPASGVASVANSLKNYEIGSWNPTLLNAGSPSLSYYALYQRIGRICHIHAKITASNVTLSSNIFRIGGLPFTAKDSGDTQQRAIIAVGGDTNNLGSNGRYMHFRTNGDDMQGVYINSTGNTAYFYYNGLSSTSIELHVHGHYTVD